MISLIGEIGTMATAGASSFPVLSCAKVFLFSVFASFRGRLDRQAGSALWRKEVAVVQSPTCGWRQVKMGKHYFGSQTQVPFSNPAFPA